MSDCKRIVNDDIARFWSKVVKDDGCWQWVGTINARHRYGQFHVQVAGKPKKVQAHRYAYELMVGPIPDGMVLDHLCRNRSCVNPAHLEPVSNRLNVLRGIAPSAKAAKLTHCPQGHPYSGSNLRIDSKGWRKCKECYRISQRARRARKRAAA